MDPDPVRSSKAPTVFALGLVAMLTGLFVGGVVPATLTLLLARQARRQAYASGGYLTGAALLRRGERLAWIGLTLAATTVVLALIVAILHFVATAGTRDYAPSVN
ncbi:hypothetical protein [Plantactinospora sp. KBS50]|uniref:hypothetical protein n=1 Tax=Plantactinospora sp. KBS50 TaxID=2024580 RepID=UPI000BAB00B6|nr:hypothetical protein [Plantactinospora sp. KBS50]ASW53527.1 hypothetical protein CIK06_04040 [Plantactinospora sp. KBS50]